MSNSVLDRFARVKALQKPLNAAMPRSSSEANTPALSEKAKSSAAEPRGFSPHLPEGAEHLAKLLGAQAVRNEFGEHLALGKWFSEVAQGVKTDCSPVGHGVADERLDS